MAEAKQMIADAERQAAQIVEEAQRQAEEDYKKALQKPRRKRSKTSKPSSSEPEKNAIITSRSQRKTWIKLFPLLSERS